MQMGGGGTREGVGVGGGSGEVSGVRVGGY